MTSDTLIGYFLSCEEYDVDELLEQAVLAEQAGFEALWISDHYHPWNDEQGQSAFVWSLIGALSQVTELPVTTAVTCPTVRIHPAVLAQAAATSHALLKGRFRLGVGTGEALNEHILGDAWPPERVRLEMLEEAIEVMRELWTGEAVQHHGSHYTVENARIYTRREDPPPVWISAFGPRAAELATRMGDGLITMMPSGEVVDAFRESGKPMAAGFKVAWADTEDEGVAHAHRLWPNAGLPGELSQVLPSPQHFAQASTLVGEDWTRENTVCGSDVEKHVAAFRPFLDAGFSEVYVANMGPNYRPMIEAYGEKVLPALRG
ncbi:TIGR03557 family F420-dependent LLM class oxidoreductase [Nocardioides sp. zg-ZUI104]|uniref:TIGR03557 family F420-dependent LLM class oxidoreductase n=1 Tax=Nocardioides faecalis TaxID=2803858 RepID=UPI001BD08B05|nr:TIGR03557 family F420-dependent LLM class oxidoreductase [Nocardioides faecalis]MBS4754532.1 TIGR03557 family F420-dependent LLM class oxidoreductase [Nocardioides faecalis]